LHLAGIFVKVPLDSFFFLYDFLKSLPVVDRGLIGLKFCENFGFLPVFGKVITLDTFQEDGKYDNRKQWLNKCVR
jgi:hypothetical protein